MGIWSYIIVIVAVVSVLTMLVLLAKNIKEKRKQLILSLISVALIESGLTLGLLLNGTALTRVLIYDALILFGYTLILTYVYFMSKRDKQQKALTTKKISYLSIVIGMSSVLMILGFSVIPVAPYLKVEFSALVIFMTYLWFDFKTAVIVSFLTNVLHFFMPGTAPVIPFMDEMVNFLATMLFLLPTVIFIRSKKLASESRNYKIIITTIAGVLFTIVLMVLFNYFINLPLIYGIPMTFTQVLSVFGLFNLIKWGLNALLINLSWRRFYILRKYLT